MTSRLYPTSLDPDCTTPLTEGMTLAQFVNALTGFGTSTHDYDLNFINPGNHYELVCKTQEVKVSFDVTYDPNGATSALPKRAPMTTLPLPPMRCLRAGLRPAIPFWAGPRALVLLLPITLRARRSLI